MRNPFRIRASQRSVSDEEFVQLFGAGALDLMEKVADPWGGLVFLRSAPGGGKTSFLRLLTPRPLRLTDQLADTDQQVKETRDALRDVGALVSSGPDLLGTMVVFTSEYREMAGFDRANALFRELVNSRIVIATLRAVLDRAGRAYPEDLDKIHFDWAPESGATIPASANGRHLFEWASDIERGFYERMDDLGVTPAVKGGHARLDGLKWFAHVRIRDPKGPVEVKRVLLLDELQTLAPGQRTSLIEFVTAAREQCGVWIAERLEALTHRDLLSEGALKDRDYEGIIQLERRWSGSKAKVFGRFVESIANLRAAKADGFENRNFFTLIEEHDDLTAWSERFDEASVKIERLIGDANGNGNRYDNWLDEGRGRSGSALDRALHWRTTQILVARDQRRAQSSFDFDALASQELEKRGSSATERAAEHFLRTEVEAPIYFGKDVLSAVSSSNVDQYLEVAGELFEEILAKIRFRREQPMPLSPERQDALIRKVAATRWEGLVRRLPRGYEARRLLEAIGEYCRQQTFRENAPYAPGVTGIAITMQDRALLIDSPDDDVRHLIPLRNVLTSLVAHNLLVPKLDHQNNGKSLVVFYLNRLLCVQFGLPLGYGGWRAKSLKDLMHWQEKGAKAETLVKEATLV
ncbi:MAG: hypothetical protein ABI395_07825 [Sphingobium sp.]